MPEPTPSDQINLKIAYFNILQNIIGRMSNYVLGIKTASITVLAALLAFSASVNGGCFNWGLFLIPWAVFLGYHVHFLRLEHAFRSIYNESTNTLNVEISDFKIDNSKLKEYLPSILNIISSFPLIIFHGSLLIVIVSAYFILSK